MKIIVDSNGEESKAVAVNEEYEAYDKWGQKPVHKLFKLITIVYDVLWFLMFFVKCITQYDNALWQKLEQKGQH